MKNNLLLLWLLTAFMVLDNNDLFGQYVWRKDVRNPILSGAGNGTWNKHVQMPSVLFNTDSARYEMWFSASAGPVNGLLHPYHIGFAVSVDGINWTMHPIPVLSPDPGTWDEYTVEAPTVIREDGQYKMWYTSVRNDLVFSWIGYATSPDGITWTKDPDYTVVEPGTSDWEIGGAWSCAVLPVVGGYKMYYGAYEEWPSSTARIGYATSDDGIVWQEDTLNNPVLNIGAPGQWDDYYVLTPQVQCIDGKYYMWYTGANFSSGAEQVGLATSPDGIAWTKYEANPVLTLSPEQWDASFVEAGTVLLIEDTLHMWYAGGRNPAATYLIQIGHATSPLDTIDIIETKSGITPYYFNLEQNYPNPFNPSTTIKFQIPTSNFVILEIYNLLGQKVVTLVNENLNAGTHTAVWTAAGFASGVYLYRLQAGNYSETKKLVLLK